MTTNKNNYKSLLYKFIPLKSFYVSKNDLYLECKKNNFIFICFFLQKDWMLLFKILLSITGCDYLNRYNRFEIVYEFFSIRFNYRCKLKIISSTNFPIFPTLTLLYQSANWWEREIWDLYGIFFKSNYNLRRILTDYGFQGFPLRKNFPVSGYKELSFNFGGIKCLYHTIELQQNSRF